MIGARGCITQVQAPDPAAGVCRPGIYQITVAWQGMNATAAPLSDCGKNQYGPDAYRRAVSTQVTIGLPTCN
jgi:type IV pilus assembly protein PilV